MGVIRLWEVLEPVRETVSLDELSGRRVAVDLSGWIFQSQGAKSLQGKVKNPHLRNLFFRTARLLHFGIRPVFILDGKAPEVKSQTLQQRHAYSKSPYKSYRSEGSSVEDSTTSDFRCKVEECCQMLDLMGLPYIQSSGEAEAMCAVLNQNGLVDGVLTSDGDAFLFGATTVYRDSTMDMRKACVESYQMTAIKSKLDLTREKLVGMALLMGCDYQIKGVANVGKELAVQLMKDLGDTDVLKRLEGWRSESVYSTWKGYKEEHKPSHCGTCKHPGSINQHHKSGCCRCDTTVDCNDIDDHHACDCQWHEHRAEYVKHQNELRIRQCAISDPEFPNKQIIKAFLNPSETCPEKICDQKRPNLKGLQDFCTNDQLLNWPLDKTKSRVAPIITQWQMHFESYLENENPMQLKPVQILKARKHEHKQVYDVKWKKTDGHCELYETVEERTLFQQSYPELIQQYEAQQETIDKHKKKHGKSFSAGEEAVSAGMAQWLDRSPFSKTRTKSAYSKPKKISNPDERYPHFVTTPDIKEHESLEIKETSHIRKLVFDLKPKELVVNIDSSSSDDDLPDVGLKPSCSNQQTKYGSCQGYDGKGRDKETETPTYLDMCYSDEMKTEGSSNGLDVRNKSAQSSNDCISSSSETDPRQYCETESESSQSWSTSSLNKKRSLVGSASVSGDASHTKKRLKTQSVGLKKNTKPRSKKTIIPFSDVNQPKMTDMFKQSKSQSGKH